MTQALAVAVAAVAFVAAAHAAPSAPLPGPAFPVYQSAAQLQTACKAGLTGATLRERALERSATARWLADADDLNAYIEDVAGPMYLLEAVHPDKSIRDAAQACTLRWQAFYSTMGQNRRLFDKARSLTPRDAVDQRYVRDMLDAFEDSGVGLPAPQRKRVKQLSDRITELSQQFSKNVREDATRVAFTPEELAGVPDGVWKDAKRDAQGRLVLGMDSPTYFPVMQGAHSAAARERMWRAKSNEGGDANLQLLAEIAQLRREMAGLFGFRSFADFRLRRSMAGDFARVNAFLNDVKAAVQEGEQRDVDELRDAKARHLNIERADAKIERWDSQYYTERVRRERFSIDQESFRPYFPPEESLAFVLRVSEKLLGAKFEAVRGVPLWHADARAFAVKDAATGAALATLYVDLYPREGKYNHAAVWPIRAASMRLKRVPQSALVVNFDRKGLTLEELETLLHELGHALHNSLSATRYSAQGGTAVLRDFVEAPSQMLEDWVYDKQVLATFAEVCPACKPVPDDLLDKAIALRDHGKGARFARQHLYASFDLALHGEQAPQPLQLWARMEGATPLGYVAGSKFPASFEHVAGGYAAAYYGYLWSLVLAMDLRTPFGADKLDPAIGARYRSTILANGGQRAPQDLVREFLGRDSDSKAFFEYLRR
jgi:thimet oligopeptidase